jgi:hypothetical protein
VGFPSELGGDPAQLPPAWQISLRSSRRPSGV